jgi:hypothetical protein
MKEWMRKYADHLQAKGKHDDAARLRKFCDAHDDIEQYTQDGNPLPATGLIDRIVIGIAIAAGLAIGD